ncbi:hypothetical protein KFK09_018503 [Dendrobium nobile]|uniref:PPIase cyclophilin-type domain-containing protein n=1 Tax=Dendrobium nobile TaxID=94219 RepID=A0A8T3AW04_DENNO|nr:hypothetical protein KFK09_018503 [Dendrobium nobile]
MGRKQSDQSGSGSRRSVLIPVLLSVTSCILVYTVSSWVMRHPMDTTSSDGGSSAILARLERVDAEVEGEDMGECCRGLEHLELWGSAVKWGTDHKFNTSRECCQACKAMCGGVDGPCLCDSWVFCGDRERCREKFGECWLKKQKDVMLPALQESGDKVIWTSGLIFGKGEGIVSLETEYGNIHIKLFPDCAPHSVAYIVELLGARHCAGCRIYRAEGRGHSWDSVGNHITEASFGPPYALIQGTLEAEGLPFKGIPVEACPTIKRGSVAWVGAGPEFFISLANHHEWVRAYTIFGSVLPEDMEIAEKIAGLPTKSDTWNSVNVSVLEKPIDLKIKRISTNNGDLNLGSNANSGSS